MVIQRNLGCRLVCIVGAFIAAFSIIIATLILFNVIPSACTFVSGLELLFLGLLFIVGVIASLVGLVLLRKRRRTEAG